MVWAGILGRETRIPGSNGFESWGCVGKVSCLCWGCPRAGFHYRNGEMLPWASVPFPGLLSAIHSFLHSVGVYETLVMQSWGKGGLRAGSIPGVVLGDEKFTLSDLEQAEWCF